jgi:hypothetical protein
MMQFLGCGPGPADIPLGDSHRPAELPRVASHGGNLTDGLPSFPDPDFGFLWRHFYGLGVFGGQLPHFTHFIPLTGPNTSNVRGGRSLASTEAKESVDRT